MQKAGATATCLLVSHDLSQLASTCFYLNPSYPRQETATWYDDCPLSSNYAIHFFLQLSVCLFVCLPACLSVCLSACMSAFVCYACMYVGMRPCLYLCISVSISKCMCIYIILYVYDSPCFESVLAACAMTRCYRVTQTWPGEEVVVIAAGSSPERARPQRGEEGQRVQ